MTLRQNPAFRATWKAFVGFAVGAISGLTTWKAAGIGASIVLLTTSWELVFGEDPTSPAPPPDVPPTP